MRSEEYEDVGKLWKGRGDKREEGREKRGKKLKWEEESLELWEMG